MKKPAYQDLDLQFVKVIRNFADDYKEFRKNAAKVFAETALSDPGSEKALANIVGQAVELQTGLLKSYGVAVGQSKGGAQHQIVPTTKITGNLKGESVFIIAPSPFDSVEVVVKKTKGKAGAFITACAKYPNGSVFNEKRKSLDKGKKAKGDSVTFVFNDMAEKVLTIYLVRTGFVTNICHYSLSIEGTFDENEMTFLARGKTRLTVRS